MTRIFELKGLDCPHCSAEIETAAGKLDGIKSAAVNLLRQTLTIELADTYNGNLSADIEKIVHTHEPDITVTEKTKENTALKKDTAQNSNKIMILRLSLGAAVYIFGFTAEHFFRISPFIFVAAYILLGVDVVFKALKNIIKGRVFDENFLMTVSTISAFAIGNYSEAAAVMLFYQIGEFFQELAVKRSRKSITELMDINPEYANAERNGKIERVSPEEVHIHEKIIIKPGEKVPLDGIVTDGSSSIDTRALTGESAPKTVQKGDTVLSGCLNGSGMLTVEVTKEFSDSVVSKIIDLVENAAEKKAPAENFITKFSRFYTPAVVLGALLLALIPPLLFGGAWSDWIRRGCVFLVVSCPCALVISIPLTFFGGIGAASKQGVLIKGSNYLEMLDRTDTIIFDKTGTLTKGVFDVSEIIPQDGISEEQLLEYTAMAEYFSNHPIAVSIQNKYAKEINKDILSDYTEFSGYGVSVKTNIGEIISGSEKAMRKFGIDFKACDKAGTRIYTALNKKFIGCIVISDIVRPDSAGTVSELKKLGIKNIVMLTGDNRQTAAETAEKLGINEYHAELLPADKVSILEEKKLSGKTVFVGDGINDAPALAIADAGIAMGGLGSDAAVEAADIVLMTDEPSKIISAVRTAKKTKKIVMQNIIFALSVKVLFLVLGAFGIAGMWSAVFGDVGVMIIAVLNAMRMLKATLHN